MVTNQIKVATQSVSGVKIDGKFGILYSNGHIDFGFPFEEDQKRKINQGRTEIDDLFDLDLIAFGRFKG